MKRLTSLVLCGAALSVCAVSSLSAQTRAAARTQTARTQTASPQVSDIRSSVDSVPQTAIVPVQQQSVRLTEYTTVYEEAGEGLNRVERRALRAKNYAACIDSLVQSHNYMFYPATMQEMPDGIVRTIYADYFFFGMFVDHVEVHLPIVRGGSQYLERLNFDSMSISNYQESRVQCGWMISFDIVDRDTHYHACLTVSTATGETILTLITPYVTMRYGGRTGGCFEAPFRIHR